MTDTEFYDTHDAGAEWATPPRIWRPLAKTLGGFDLDPASGCEPIQIADNTFTESENGLAQDWVGDVWVNPPYGRDHNEQWAKKTAHEARRGEVKSITALVPASIGSQWYQRYYATARFETHIAGRVEFIGVKNGKASFDSVLLTWGDVPDGYIEVLHSLGSVREIISDPTETTQANFSDVTTSQKQVDADACGRFGCTRDGPYYLKDGYVQCANCIEQ